MSGMADGRIVGQADRLREGEPVEYLSKTHGRWVSAFVERVHSDGSVSLDIKPRADPSRVRRRAWRVGERVEYNSRSRGGWVSATVERVHSDGSVTLDFGDVGGDEETGAVHTLACSVDRVLWRRAATSTGGLGGR